MSEKKPTSNAMLIKKYFFTNGETASECLNEIKQLTKEDKEELGELIRRQHPDW